MTDLSVLADLNEMVDLNISYNPVSDITPLLNYPKLERLFLSIPMYLRQTMNF